MTSYIITSCMIKKDHTLDDADVYARANSRGWESGGYLYELGMSKVEDVKRYSRAK